MLAVRRFSRLFCTSTQRLKKANLCCVCVWFVSRWLQRMRTKWTEAPQHSLDNNKQTNKAKAFLDSINKVFPFPRPQFPLNHAPAVHCAF